MVISFVGDISLHGINKKEFQIDSKIIKIFSTSDFTCGNLENPITNSNTIAEHAVVSLKSNENVLHFVKNFDVVNLCNNHIFDFGIKGFNDTIAFLEKINVNFFGAGETKYKAQKPFVFQKNTNEKIAILGGKLMSGPRWPDAKKNQYGTSGNKGLRKIIKKLKKENYFIIYYPHWGYEYIQTPPPNIRRHAKRMINLGVDLIIGSHPHVLQGFEKYKNKYIFYSLGNFIFDVQDIKNFTTNNNHVKTTQSIILNLNIEDKKLKKFDFIPILFGKSGVSLADSFKSNEIINQIHQMSVILQKNYFKYIYEYYAQTPDILRQNQRIYSKFDSRISGKKQSTIQKIKLMTLQGVLNRIAAKLFSLKKHY